MTGLAWYLRPRGLYTSVYVWLSMTGGRFLAPFLEHQARFSPLQVGVALAANQAISTLTGSAGGAWADHLEHNYPGQGRAWVIGLGIVSGTCAFLLHDASSLWPSCAFFSSAVWFVMLRCMYAASTSLVFPALDGMTLSFLQEHSSKTDYGKERLYGAVSWAGAHMLLALSLDGFGGFWVAYYWAVLATIGLVIHLVTYVQAHKTMTHQKLDRKCSDVVTERPRVSFGTLLRLLAGTPYALSFLFAVFCVSLGQIVVDNLIFLYFEFLGSSYSLMGLTVLLTVAFEIPIFHLAPWLLERLGSGMLLLVAAVCYSGRVLAYSLIPKGHVPYALLLEPLHGITYGCVQTAVVDFAAQNVPKGYEASGQGIVSVARGLGSVLGLLWGGWATQNLGPRLMYRASAAVVILGNLFLTCYTCRRKHQPTLPVQDEDEDLELTEYSEESDFLERVPQ